MKSLYSCIKESIFDDEEVISKEADVILQTKDILDKILYADSFKDYEHQITVLKKMLDDNLKLYCGPDKKPRFKSGGTYIAINPVDTNLIYKNRNGKIHHSSIWIGTAGSPIHYIIDAVENVFGRHDCVETGVSHYNLKVKYANRPDHDSYIYKIDGTGFEGLLTHMQGLKPFTMHRINR